MKKGARYRIWQTWEDTDFPELSRDLDQGISALCDECAEHFDILESVGDPVRWASYWEPLESDWARCLVCKEKCTGK